MTDHLAADPTHPPDTGFELGWDHAQRGLVPPTEHLHPLSPVRQGWDAGREHFGRRTLQADRFVRKWLQLRLNAWLRGRAFEDTAVTPAFLRRIDVAVCPVTREPLTHGTGEPSDASVDRVFNDAAYAAGNLAVMSTRANQAKSLYGVDDAMAFVRQIEAGQLGRIDGLDAEQWARIAVLSSFATPMPHAKAACLPLLVLPPQRLRVLNPVQALQVMLSLQFTLAGHARRCAALAMLMPSADARYAFNAFMHTLLARRLARGGIPDPVAERQAVEERFKTPNSPRWYPNLLSCTPTLEMGIDIGDLSTAILCSVPPTTANFLQRVGRAGRTNGNAFAMTMVQKPLSIDVAVTENMFGDILSDLGAALMGGMGYAPSADIGDERAVFQPCHGSAPDIAGKGLANPAAMVLSASMMLDWLGETKGVAAAGNAGRMLREAVENAFAPGALVTCELGGDAGTATVFEAVSAALEKVDA